MLEGAKLMGAGAATIASAGAAIGIGNVLSSLIHSVARNPKQSFGYAILGFALTEAIAFFALMMAFLTFFLDMDSSLILERLGGFLANKAIYMFLKRMSCSTALVLSVGCAFRTLLAGGPPVLPFFGEEALGSCKKLLSTICFVGNPGHASSSMVPPTHEEVSQDEIWDTLDAQEHEEKKREHARIYEEVESITAACEKEERAMIDKAEKILREKGIVIDKEQIKNALSDVLYPSWEKDIDGRLQHFRGLKRRFGTSLPFGTHS